MLFLSEESEGEGVRRERGRAEDIEKEESRGGEGQRHDGQMGHDHE